jgi:hypothetical protein
MTLENKLETWARENLPVYEFMDLKVLSVSQGLYKCLVPMSRNTGNHVKNNSRGFSVGRR